MKTPMKHIILRYEDHAPTASRVAPLLEGAKTVHLHQLAQAGAAGVIKPRESGHGLNRFELHRGLLGLSLDDAEGTAGHCYASGLNLHVKDETLWCCEFVTQQGGAIIDPTAGSISTTESEVLIQALNDQLGSEARRWVVGQGSRHVLVMTDPALSHEQTIRLYPPELAVGQPWRRALPKSDVGAALESLIEQGAKVLEEHPINRVRLDLGENPANMLWLWGGAPKRSARSFTERTGFSGALVSTAFPLRGLAQSLGLLWTEGPASYEEPALQRLLKSLLALVDRHDVIYVHFRIDTADPVERLCAMERIDQLLLKPLTEHVPAKNPWRLLTVVDDRSQAMVPFVAIGSGLPQHPVVQLQTQQCAETPLAFPDGVGLFSWLTKT